MENICFFFWFIISRMHYKFHLNLCIILLFALDHHTWPYLPYLGMEREIDLNTLRSINRHLFVCYSFGSHSNYRQVPVGPFPAYLYNVEHLVFLAMN